MASFMNTNLDDADNVADSGYQTEVSVCGFIKFQDLLTVGIDYRIRRAQTATRAIFLLLFRITKNLVSLGS